MSTQGRKGNEPWNDPNFVAVTRTLNAIGAPYFICCGTLLRLHRDGGLSPSDGDIDIWFPEDSLRPEEAFRILQGLGFQTRWLTTQNLGGQRDGGRNIDFGFPFEAVRATTQAVNIPHQVMTWEIANPTNGRRLRRLVNSQIRLKLLLNKRSKGTSAFRLLVLDLIYISGPFLGLINRYLINYFYRRGKLRRIEYRVPSQFLSDLEKLSMSGVQWYQPRDTELVLQSLYGEDWRTPRIRKVWFEFAKEAPPVRLR